MKKFTAVLFALILLLCSSLTSFADETKFEKMKDLNNYWAINDAYPDWFCGVWTETGSLNNLIVAVLDTEDGEKGKQEILDLIEDDLSVTFTYGEYSRNYLISVQNSFTYEMFKELGLSYTAFLDDKSRIELGILYEKRNDTKAQEKLEEIKKQYGDIFTVKYVDGIVSADVQNVSDLPAIHYSVIAEQPAKPTYFVYIAVSVSLVLSLSCVFLIFKLRRAFAFITNTGGIVSANRKLSSEEVRNLVRKSEVEIPIGLEERIIKEIENRI